MDDATLKRMIIKSSKGMVWQCPNCTAVLEKKGVEPELAELFGSITGTNTCSHCQTSYLRNDVYGGKYDISLDKIRLIAGDKLIDRGINLLINTLADRREASDARLEAIRTLTTIGGKRIIDALKGISKDPDQEVRIAAREALEVLGPNINSTSTTKKWWQFWK